jgi:Icc protein
MSCPRHLQYLLALVLLLGFASSVSMRSSAVLGVPLPDASITGGPTVNLLTNSSTVIMWTTQTATRSEVDYGTDPGSLALSASNETSAIEHRVPLASLLADTRYYYRAGNGTAWSSIHEFVTGPNDDTGFTFLVYGDHRPATGDTAPPELGQLIGLMVARQPRFVISLGDHVLHPNPASWASYAAQTDRIQGNACYWVVLGNHDVGGTSVMADWYEWPDEGTRNYYSFDYGNCHVVVLDAYDGGDNKLGAAQLAWLNADLAATTAKHRFICVHPPLFPTGAHIGSSLDVNTTLRDSLWQIFENRSVEAVFVAHEHFYYRLQVGTIPQITTGGGGAPLYATNRLNIYPVEVYDTTFEYVEVDVAGDSVTYTAYDIDDQVIDQFSTTSVLSPRPHVTDLHVSPYYPEAENPFNVTVSITNSTPLADVTCRYRETPASTYTSATMILVDGSAHEYVASLGPLTVTQPFYVFYVEVNDTAGANYRSLLSSFVVDAVAPSVTIQQPANHSTVAGLTAIQPLVEDDVGVIRVEFYVDGVLQANLSVNATYLLVPWNWNTNGYANGLHTIEVIVYDRVGRSSSTVVSLEVNNAALPQIPPIWIAAGAGVLAAGVAVVLALVIIRRRRSEPGK